MSHIGVIDTCVLIGFTIEQDQHHTTCKEYILDGGHEDVILPPRARNEYSALEREIRSQISDEIIQHRHQVQEEVRGDQLDRGGLEYIQGSLLDKCKFTRSYTALYKFYSNIMKSRATIYKQEITEKLSNLETEVWIDRSDEYGGWRSCIDVWTKDVADYPSIEKDLLICEGDDPKICIEAHHIATQYEGVPTKIATANSRHFIDRVEGEAESRADNITRLTDITDVIDLSAPLEPSL